MTNIYIANDGKEFFTKKDCMAYENALKVVIETANNSGLKQALITIAEYCHKQISCWDCPMRVGGCILKNKTPDYWLRLKEKEEKK